MQPVDMRPAGAPPVATPRPAAPAAGQLSPQSVPPTGVELKQAVEATNAALKKVANNLEFELDAGTGKTVVRVVDAGTGQVIRQMPSEEMLAIARTLDHLQGLLIRQKA
jgi:flagellar protein FlaG